MSDNIKVGYVYEDDLFDDVDFGDEKMELFTSILDDFLSGKEQL